MRGLDGPIPAEIIEEAERQGIGSPFVRRWGAPPATTGVGGTLLLVFVVIISLPVLGMALANLRLEMIPVLLVLGALPVWAFRMYGPRRTVRGEVWLFENGLVLARDDDLMTYDLRADLVRVDRYVQHDSRWGTTSRRTYPAISVDGDEFVSLLVDPGFGFDFAGTLERTSMLAKWETVWDSLEAGGEFDAGALTLTRDGVRSGARSLAYADITRCELDDENTRLTIATRAQTTSYRTNALLELELVRAMVVQRSPELRR